MYTPRSRIAWVSPTSRGGISARTDHSIQCCSVSIGAFKYKTKKKNINILFWKITKRRRRDSKVTDRRMGLEFSCEGLGGTKYLSIKREFSVLRYRTPYRERGSARWKFGNRGKRVKLSRYQGTRVHLAVNIVFLFPANTFQPPTWALWRTPTKLKVGWAPIELGRTKPAPPSKNCAFLLFLSLGSPGLFVRDGSENSK